MPRRPCAVEGCERAAALVRPKTGQAVCRPCFLELFEAEVHDVIVKHKLFQRGQKVGIGASGGKDSTVLVEILCRLNKKYDYGLELCLLSVDEGIYGYRDDSLGSVKRNQEEYDLKLKIVSFKELYGWSLDEIVKSVGQTSTCTFCGVFRRQALDRAALDEHVDIIVTGHNADDVAETVVMNFLRGDVARLRRTGSIFTGVVGELPRCKPLMFSYEKEIVMYAYFRKLDYFSTECHYSAWAVRLRIRQWIKDMETLRPRIIIDILNSVASLRFRDNVRMPKKGSCVRCGYISSHSVCKGCALLENLNKGTPLLAIGRLRRRAADRDLPEEQPTWFQEGGRVPPTLVNACTTCHGVCTCEKKKE